MQLTLAPGRSSSPNLMAACSFVIWKKNHKSLIINLFFSHFKSSQFLLYVL